MPPPPHTLGLCRDVHTLTHTHTFLENVKYSLFLKETPENKDRYGDPPHTSILVVTPGIVPSPTPSDLYPIYFDYTLFSKSLKISTFLRNPSTLSRRG